MATAAVLNPVSPPIYTPPPFNPQFEMFLDPNAQEFQPHPENAELSVNRFREEVPGKQGVGDSTVTSTVFYYPSPVAASASRGAMVYPSSIAREHSSRSIILMGLDAAFQDLAGLRLQLEKWGPVRHISHHKGIVAHFFDLRHAVQALEDIQAQHLMQQHKFLLLRRREQLHLGDRDQDSEVVRLALREVDFKLNRDKGLICGRAIWAQFVPLCCCADENMADSANHGTLVVFNVDPTITPESVRTIFQKFGAVKEIRETPVKKGHRFVEFYDVRDAAAALRALNGTEIDGRVVKIEFSRPGGARRHGQHMVSRRRPELAAQAFYNSSMEPVGPGYYPWWPNDSYAHYYYFYYTYYYDWPAYHYYHQPQYYCCPGYGSPGCFPKRRQLTIEDKPGNEDAYCVNNEDMDLRTTLMVRNIPNKYRQALLEKFDKHCAQCNVGVTDLKEVSAFDFMYLPVDHGNGCNKGYAFINFTTVAGTRKFYKAFQNLQWEPQNRRKICDISYARLQGRHALETARLLKGAIYDPPRTGSCLN